MTYDDLGYRTAVRDALNNVVQMSYDSAGNLIKTDIKDPANVLQLTRSYIYDERNQLTIKGSDSLILGGDRKSKEFYDERSTSLTS